MTKQKTTSLWPTIIVGSAVAIVAVWAFLGQRDASTTQSPKVSPTVPGPEVSRRVQMPAAGQQITNVELSAASFSTDGGSVALSYDLPQDARVTVSVWDPDGGLTWRKAAAQSAGRQTVTWDGRDIDGVPVPDEAWTFTIETDGGVVYDPTTMSGGVVGDITKVQTDPLTGNLTYTLPAPARVLIRLGIKDGPMHKTLVDWQPRLPGPVLEPWDGMDESRMLRVIDQPAYSGIVTYVTLPETSVITHGNSAETYRAYKLGRAKGRAARPERERQATAPPAPVGLVPPAWQRSPEVQLELPGLPEGTPTVPHQGVVNVRVNAAAEDRDQLIGSQFEIMFYVDGKFFAEAERGTLPYLWRWELLRLPPGPHLLTTNLVSMDGKVGVASRQVIIAEAKQ